METPTTNQLVSDYIVPRVVYFCNPEWWYPSLKQLVVPQAIAEESPLSYTRVWRTGKGKEKGPCACRREGERRKGIKSHTCCGSPGPSLRGPSTLVEVPFLVDWRWQFGIQLGDPGFEPFTLACRPGFDGFNGNKVFSTIPKNILTMEDGYLHVVEHLEVI